MPFILHLKLSLFFLETELCQRSVWSQIYFYFTVLLLLVIEYRIFHSYDDVTIAGEGCAFWPMLSTHGHWALGVLWCNTYRIKKNKQSLKSPCIYLWNKLHVKFTWNNLCLKFNNRIKYLYVTIFMLISLYFMVRFQYFFHKIPHAVILPVQCITLN